MPAVLIEIRRNATPEEGVALMDAVHAALREAFKILPTDRTERLVVHGDVRFDDGCERADLSALVHPDLEHGGVMAYLEPEGHGGDADAVVEVSGGGVAIHPRQLS